MSKLRHNQLDRSLFIYPCPYTLDFLYICSSTHTCSHDHWDTASNNDFHFFTPRDNNKQYSMDMSFFFKHRTVLPSYVWRKWPDENKKYLPIESVFGFWPYISFAVNCWWAFWSKMILQSIYSTRKTDIFYESQRCPSVLANPTKSGGGGMRACANRYLVSWHGFPKQRSSGGTTWQIWNCNITMRNRNSTRFIGIKPSH